MSPLRGKDLELTFGGKEILTPVGYSGAIKSLAGRPYLNAQELSYRLPSSEVRFQREAKKVSNFTISPNVSKPGISKTGHFQTGLSRL